jgi:methylated-DNA-[protein]-cysteine S-methyltransferase
MEFVRYQHLETPIGRLLISSTDRGVCRIDFDKKLEPEEELAGLEKWAASKLGSAASLIPGGGACEEAAGQLAEYFRGGRTRFELPLDLMGTPFQLQVWGALAEIPYGVLCSYKQVAEAIGSPKAVRAVGGANNKNPVPVVIPCHRVVGAGGDMVGYAGGLHIKHKLLELEGLELHLTSDAGVMR